MRSSFLHWPIDKRMTFCTICEGIRSKSKLTQVWKLSEIKHSYDRWRDTYRAELVLCYQYIVFNQHNALFQQYQITNYLEIWIPTFDLIQPYLQGSELKYHTTMFSWFSYFHFNWLQATHWAGSTYMYSPQCRRQDNTLRRTQSKAIGQTDHKYHSSHPSWYNRLRLKYRSNILLHAKLHMSAFLTVHYSAVILVKSMGWCKKDVTPLLTHWSYIFIALTHRNDLQTDNDDYPKIALISQTTTELLFGVIQTFCE